MYVVRAKQSCWRTLGEFFFSRLNITRIIIRWVGSFASLTYIVGRSSILAKILFVCVSVILQGFLFSFWFFHTINGRCNDVRWCHISTHPTKLGIDMQPFSILFSRPFGCFVFFFSLCANCRRCIIGRFFGRYKALLRWCYFLFCFIQCAPFSRITKRISVLN